MKKSARRRIDVNLDELDRVLDGARQAPLSEADYDKVKDALHAMAAMLVRPRNTEKTSAVLDEAEDSGKAATQPDNNAAPPVGHGRNGAEAFGGAQRQCANLRCCLLTDCGDVDRISCVPPGRLYLGLYIHSVPILSSDMMSLPFSRFRRLAPGSQRTSSLPSRWLMVSAIDKTSAIRLRWSGSAGSKIGLPSMW